MLKNNNKNDEQLMFSIKTNNTDYFNLKANNFNLNNINNEKNHLNFHKKTSLNLGRRESNSMDLTNITPVTQSGLRRPCLVFTNLNDFTTNILSNDDFNKNFYKSLSEKPIQRIVDIKELKKSEKSEILKNEKFNKMSSSDKKKEKKEKENKERNILLKFKNRLNILNSASLLNHVTGTGNYNIDSSGKSGNLQIALFNNEILNEKNKEKSGTIFSRSSNASTSNMTNTNSSMFINKNNNYDIFMKFRNPPIIFSIITKYLEEPIDNYVHHNISLLEYDTTEVFVLIFKTNIFITKFIDDNLTEIPKENPMLYKINYMNIFHFELIVTEDSEDYNSIIIQFFENDYSKKSEM
jgi:hypothetical protein